MRNTGMLMPQYATALAISDAQRTALIKALADGFDDGPAIGRALSDGEQELGDVMDLRRGRMDVAADAVQRAIKDEQVPRLLRLAISGARLNLPLRTIAREIDPTIEVPAPALADPAAPADVGQVAYSIEMGVKALARHRSDWQVYGALRAAVGPLQGAGDGLTKLTHYKALHDLLHSVPYRLETIAIAAANLFKEGAVREQAAQEMLVYAADLGRLVQQAKQEAAGLPDDYDQNREREWIEELQQHARQLRQAAKTDPALACTAMEGIGSLQRQQAPFINALMMQVAGTLPLQSLRTALDLIAPALKQVQEPSAARPFEEAQLKLLELERAFAAEVKAHKLWQMIDNHLSMEEHAGTASVAILAQRKRCEDKLRSLISRDRDADWAMVVARELPNWMDADTEQEGLAAFQILRNRCRDQFLVVDKELLAMCGKLGVITKPLSELRTLAEE